jgi:hypothetical protein
LSKTPTARRCHGAIEVDDRDGVHPPPGRRGSGPLAAEPAGPAVNNHALAGPPTAAREATDESACTPDSVPAPPLSVRRWRPSISACRRRQALAAYPQARTGHPRAPARAITSRRGPFLALLRVGFTEPSRSPGMLVGSYSTVSPLPGRLGPAVCFLWHCPAGHPGLPLATTLPCGVRTFLGGGHGGPHDAAARPTRPSSVSLRRPGHSPETAYS